LACADFIKTRAPVFIETREAFHTKRFKDVSSQSINFAHGPSAWRAGMRRADAGTWGGAPWATPRPRRVRAGVAGVRRRARGPNKKARTLVWAWPSCASPLGSFALGARPSCGVARIARAIAATAGISGATDALATHARAHTLRLTRGTRGRRRHEGRRAHLAREGLGGLRLVGGGGEHGGHALLLLGAASG
jgi:hypothetical protein